MPWYLHVMTYLRPAILGTYLKIILGVVVCNFARISLGRWSFTFEAGSEIMFW
jgi:hypothetical protein